MPKDVLRDSSTSGTFGGLFYHEKPPKKEEVPMPKRITPLSEIKVRTAQPKEAEYKIFDGGGLFLLVTPSGGKLWYFNGFQVAGVAAVHVGNG